MDYQIIYSIILLLLMVISLTILNFITVELLYMSEPYANLQQYNGIPKVIWTTWDSDDIPLLVTKCIDSWRFHNPDHKINIVTPSNMNRFLPGFNPKREFRHLDSPARESDLIRLNLLSKYGGIWMDSSIICNKPLKWMHDLIGDREFFGYYIESFTTNKRYPVIESWCFACKVNCKFMSDWKNAFMQINDFESVEEYVKHAKGLGVDIQNISTPEYLAVHVAAQYVLQIMKYPISRMILLKAEDGPWAYLVRNDWDSHKAVLEIKNGTAKEDLVKMRGIERKFIETF